MTLVSVNPVDGSVIREYRATEAREVGAVLERAVAGQRAWDGEPRAVRAQRLRLAADALRRRAGEFGELMALEMGKPVPQGVAEAEKCAWVCEYYAEEADRFLATEEIPTEAARSFVTYRPLGVVLAVMPWNFPFWQVFRSAAPAVMAGNAAVLKHAANVSGCALAIEAVFREAGFPDGVFQTVLLPSSRVADLIRHPAIAAVTLTGSTAAGRAVAAVAGAAVKKTVLELGGSDPYVILEDADIAEAAATCATSRLINGGQSCIAAKRFIVVEPVLREFEERLVEAMRGKTMGDPFAAGVDLGPQARHDLRDEVHLQVTESVERGARLLLGGSVPEGPGAFYPPTVLADVAPGMPASDDEIFGPVGAIIRARDERDAIRIANDSTFGLGAAVFTGDAERGMRIAAERLDAGCCFVNAYVKSDPRLPFGGVKLSGYGRELSSFGIREFVNVKTVYVR